MLVDKLRGHGLISMEPLDSNHGPLHEKRVVSTPSVPLKPSQILPAKTGNQPDWNGFSGT